MTYNVINIYKTHLLTVKKKQKKHSYSHHPYCCYVYTPVQPVCTSLSSLLFILLFIKSHILFLHILLVLHFSLFYCTLYSLFLFFTYIYALVLCYFYIIFIFILLHCPLSGPDLIYISLLIIPCIIYYVTNKQTLNLELVLYTWLYLHYIILYSYYLWWLLFNLICIICFLILLWLF